MERQVSEILFNHWDIAGVNHMPECSDEYDSYSADIVTLLAEYNCTAEHIQQHLAGVREAFFGLPANDKEDALAAEKLLKLYEQETSVQNKLIEQLNKPNVKYTVLEQLGYQASDNKALQRLNNVINDKYLGLASSYFDTKYSNIEYLNALCELLLLDNYQTQLNQLQNLAHHSQFGFAPTIFIDTHFKRNNESIFVWAVMEPKRNISFDRLQSLQPLAQQILTVQQWIAEHYKNNNGRALHEAHIFYVNQIPP